MSGHNKPSSRPLVSFHKQLTDAHGPTRIFCSSTARGHRPSPCHVFPTSRVFLSCPPLFGSKKPIDSATIIASIHSRQVVNFKDHVPPRFWKWKMGDVKTETPLTFEVHDKILVQKSYIKNKTAHKFLFGFAKLRVKYLNQKLEVRTGYYVPHPKPKRPGSIMIVVY